MRKLLGNLGSLFHLRPKQRGAAIILCILITSVYMLPYLLEPYYSFTAAEKEAILKNYLKSKEPIGDSIYRHISGEKNDLKQELKIAIGPFIFDPNSVDSIQLLELGFSKYVSGNILKYRSKGGRFYTRTDLLKIYGIDRLHYNNLEEYIQIEERGRHMKSVRPVTNVTRDSLIENAVFKKQDESRLQVKVKLDLNLADSLALTKLKGVGTVFASRIVRYRARLGGFHSIDQLKEVYGFPTETFNEIQHEIYIKEPWQVLDWQALPFKELLKHPYIDYEQTKILKNYKGSDPKGFLDSLLSSGTITKELYLYLKAY